MPAAKTKAALIAVTEKEWDKLSKLITDFDETFTSIEDGDGSSAIRILGHRAAWIDLYFAWCKGATAGHTPEMPAPGMDLVCNTRSSERRSFATFGGYSQCV
ncbi:MAG: ClbS/DfsB family four-helix bundle protein [Pseudomonadota bacterium]